MKVYISYSSEDREVAKKVVSKLEQAGFEPWDPAAALFAGDNWALHIGKALQDSDAMVLLISPKSMKSEWVRHEIEFALGSPRYKGRLIPVMVKPTKDIPWILKRLPMVQIGKDFTAAVREIANHIKLGFELVPAKS